jgi:DNA-binding transcriptional LysR family regulator
MSRARTPWPPPLDLYGLGLLRMIERCGSITRAAAEAGLTQSALTRQVQGMESRLGVALFDRSTRRIQLTPAGLGLLTDTAGIMPLLDAALQNLDRGFLNAPREVRIGVSRSVALAHLPGLLHAHLRRAPDVKTTVEHMDSAVLISRVETGELDVGVLCPPPRLPPAVTVTHRMEDVFHLIAPAGTVPPGAGRPRSWTPRLTTWLERQQWLLVAGSTQTGTRLRRWLRQHGMEVAPAMEPDHFDIIIHLVALGLGMSLVPRRAIAGFARRRQLLRIPLPEEFQRTLAVIVPKGRQLPQHVRDFVDQILFS